MTDRPLRICLVATFYPPFNFGGDGIAVQRLAVALAERGHHVEVVHSEDAFRTLQPPGVPPLGDYADHAEIVHHGLRSKHPLLSALITQQTARPGVNGPGLRRILARGKFDVVHFHNPSLIGVTALGYAPDAVTLYTMHEHWLVCPTHVLWRFNREPCTARRCTRCQLTYRRPPQLWRHTGVLDRSLKHVNAFIAPSRFTRDKHREFGFPSDARVVHIPNFLPQPTPVLGEDLSPHHTPYFLFVGRLERIKGAHVLVDTFTRYARADLLLAGTGADADDLRVQASGSPHVRFLGQLPYSQLQALMRHAIAVVVPSVGFEVFPTTVLEANAQGTPVIGHRLGPLPEMLDGRGGLTYGDEPELIAALESLRTDPARRRDVGARGRAEYLAEWTPDRHLGRYFDLIETLNSEKVSFA